MPKANIIELDQTEVNNADLNGNDIAENCDPGTINNALRALAGMLKKFADDTAASAVAGGTADVITLTTNQTVLALADGIKLSFIAAGTCTGGGVTLAVDGLAAKPVYKGNDAALADGDITTNMPTFVIYDASANAAAGAWKLVNPLPGSIAGLLANIVEDITPAFGGEVDGQGNDMINLGTIKMVEQAAAEDDTEASGQIWVKTATPNELWFSDDAGNDYQIGVLNRENQPVTGGATVAPKDLGTGSGAGTVTLDVGDCPLQDLINGGAFTLAPGTVYGACILTVLNDASAGAITTSGFTIVAGDIFDTTNTNKFRCHVCVNADGSSLIITAMQ